MSYHLFLLKELNENDNIWHIFDVATDFALVILVYKAFVGDGKTGHLWKACNMHKKTLKGQTIFDKVALDGQ
jgi:hypothetical protein